MVIAGDLYCGMYKYKIVATCSYSTIVAAARLLPACPDHSHLTNLSDWLNALSLSYLEAKLIISGYSNLKKLSQLQPWDIELLSVSGHMTSHDP